MFDKIVRCEKLFTRRVSRNEAKYEGSVRVNICGVEWKNPVATAAGVFVCAESSKYFDPAALGAVTTKGVSAEPWAGNPTPRIAETPSGMLNAVGLENPGVDAYIAGELRTLKERGATVVANAAGHSEDEYVEVCRRLDATDVDMIELNVSCPNIREGGMAFGTDARTVERLTKKVRSITDKPLIVKLSPNVTDITECAVAAERAGADALSLINTMLGMRIDRGTGKPVLANLTGGLSGPAIRPIAVRMVYETARSVSIPIIGMGGIMTGDDALEFLLAGASAVEVGTAALIDPSAPVRVSRELNELLSDPLIAEVLDEARRKRPKAFC
ncbi:MAG: dihydroorotate dehydrogenase [Clostridiales Family XIII bacterium]|jgi:dihydroorotate dehydrogenase (NAD+) catalytic subunit|nr:dihydroorotate dehydrogenase [Clostridiales Family XIII bacterium]